MPWVGLVRVRVRKGLTVTENQPFGISGSAVAGYRLRGDRRVYCPLSPHVRPLLASDHAPLLTCDEESAIVSLAHVQGLIREHLSLCPSQDPSLPLLYTTTLLICCTTRTTTALVSRSSVARDLEPTWQRHQRPQAGRWPRHSRSCSTTVATIRQRSRDTISAGVTRAPAAADT